jgi:hypothetical protein
VDLVVDDFFDEVGRWHGHFVRFSTLRVKARGVAGSGGVWDGCGCGDRLAGEEFGDDLHAVKEFAGAEGVQVVGGDALEEVGGDGQGGGAVFDDGEFEGLVLVDVAELAGGRFGAAGGVVVVAEMLVAEGRRAALVSGGVDVAAAVALLGDGDEFGLLWHGGTPLGCLVLIG